jgi:membrane associated rhomboid family serine protease
LLQGSPLIFSKQFVRRLSRIGGVVLSGRPNRWNLPAAMTDLHAPKFTDKREPIFNIPLVVVLLVLALLAIHAAISSVGAASADWIIAELGFIPGRLTLAFEPGRLADLLARANVDPQALQQAAIVRQYQLYEGAKLWTLLTYAGLHGSWTHVGLNSIWIVAFGPPVARRIGGARFLMLFCVTAIAGALAHYVLNPMDFTPLIGASAADSGLMAAAARFMFQPGAALGSPGGFSTSDSQPRFEPPAPGIATLLRDRRTLIFVAIWMISNFIFGAGAESFGLAEGPVAWIAHIGGFAAGFLLFPWFDRRARREDA